MADVDGAGGAKTFSINLSQNKGIVSGIDFAVLTPDQGFTVTGAALGDGAGGAVSNAGDVNNDGIDDFIVGAQAAASGAGTTYVVYGKTGGLADIDLACLDADDGFKIAGAAAGDRSGSAVSHAGDINGDGIADLLVGAPGADPSGLNGAGKSYVIYGKTGGPGDIDLDILTAAQGAVISGIAAEDFSGQSVRSAGDVNGDGVEDIIIGAPGVDGPDRSYSGESYVVYGKLGGIGDINLASLAALQGFRILGADGDYTGLSVSGAGDINGDGFDDVIVGAESGVPGNSWVIFGKAGGPGDIDFLANITPAQGFKISGFGDYESSGHNVAAAGDINGDGFEDLVIGAAEAHGPNGSYAGHAIVIYGKAGGPGDIDLETLTPDQGFKVFGGYEYDFAGASVSSAGDVNGDGIDDVLIGAPGADVPGRLDAGEAYLIFGQAGGLSDIDLANLTPDQGLRLSGAGARDSAGDAVSTAGDINGDGFADIIIGAPESSYTALGNGKAHVVYGGDFTDDVTHQGTDGNDALSGTNAEENFVGGLGDDMLTGGGGTDSFLGGAGDDAIHVGDGGFRRADGGTGNDTLHLDFAGLIDLGNIDGDASTGDHAKIRAIETIDLDNGSANQLTLSLVDVLEIDADTVDVGGIASLDNVLKIDGGTTDTLSLDPADGWSAADTTTLAGYAVYTCNNVKIAVDQDIDVVTA